MQMFCNFSLEESKYALSKRQESDCSRIGQSPQILGTLSHLSVRWESRDAGQISRCCNHLSDGIA